MIEWVPYSNQVVSNCPLYTIILTVKGVGVHGQGERHLIGETSPPILLFVIDKSKHSFAIKSIRENKFVRVNYL